jgi:subtilisin family serine protease
VCPPPFGAYARKTEQEAAIFPSVTNSTDRISTVAERIEDDELPAWSLDRDAIREQLQRLVWPLDDPREWAWGGSHGAGVRVCVIDSGVDSTHPMVGTVQGAVSVTFRDDGELTVVADDEGDAFGHGTACAAIIRKLAPECEIHSVRVLGGELTGAGPVLLHGLRWAIEQRFEVINLSLSTTKSRFAAELRELADRAYFRGTILVASAHNMPVESFPWRFSSVLSVGSHAGDDPLEYYVNPGPPVEFAAPGVNLELAWLDGTTITATGNSFAGPHIAGIAALVLSKHGRLRPFELKTALFAASSNVRRAA